MVVIIEILKHLYKYRGLIFGGLVGVFVSTSFFALHTYTDCFSCGFIGIDYCEYERGMCPTFNFYRNALALFLVPLALVGAPLVYVLVEILGLPFPSNPFLVLACVGYFSLFGAMIQRFFEHKVDHLHIE